MSEQSESDIARAGLGALKVSVRVDGDWCREMAWYTPDLPVFTTPNGGEVDIRDDGSILYETPDGAVQEIEPADETDGVRTFHPMNIYPADTIEIHETDMSRRHEPADFGGGESTGVQSL